METLAQSGVEWGPGEVQRLRLKKKESEGEPK